MRGKVPAADYEFAEGTDYFPVLERNNGKRGQPRKDYLLTVSVAKDITEALTPVEQNGEPMIDARSLHQWLGIGRDFSNWIRKLL